MTDNIGLLLRLWWRPVTGMSAVLDRGSLLFASIAVLVVSAMLQWSLRAPFGFYIPLLLLAGAYVPVLVILSALLGGLGGAGAVLSRDYSSMLTCTAMAWSAAHLPLALTARAVPLPAVLGLAAVCVLYFVVLMFFAVRTVFGVGGGVAAGAVLLSWLPLPLAVVVWIPLQMVLGFLASPCLLFYGWYYLGRDLSGIGEGMRRRQNFRRMLDASTVNPYDADAQYQLGLIHQQRRQYTEAIARFRKAVEIDATETDAHFQLGRIARQQGRAREALECFQAVINLDEKHHQSEILREVGALYADAGQFEDARRELAVYVERRPYDPEGLYHYGRALEGIGDATAARQMYSRTIEAVRTAPPYRRREIAAWSRMAHTRMRGLVSR